MLTIAEAGHGTIHETVHVAVGIMSIACAVGVLTKFVRVPYTAALVLAGLVIALTGIGPQVYLTEELVLILFLPPLLFQAGLHLDLGHLRSVWKPVLVMALPGVLLTMFAVAAATKPFLTRELGEAGATWAVALLLGVVAAPTDPISVLAAFKTAGVPEKLKTIVEGESLFNDGTAVALFSVLKVAAAGSAVGLAHGEGEATGEIDALATVITFVRVAGLGTIIGAFLGLVAFAILRKLEDHTLETAFTIALAWGAFVLAEDLHASGVIAVVVAGLIMGNYGKALSMSESTRTTLTGFWDSIDFAVNSALFLLVGFELRDPEIGGPARLLNPNVLMTAGVVILTLAAARALVVYPTLLVLKREWPRGWKHVVWFAGLRGSLSLALVLGLPSGDLRSFLAPVLFLVVLFSLLGEAVLMPAWIRLVGGNEHEAGTEPADH